MHLFLQDTVIDAMSREIVTVSPDLSIKELEQKKVRTVVLRAQNEFRRQPYS